MKTQTAVALFTFVRPEYRSEFVHPTLRFVTIADDNKPRNLDGDHPLAELEVTGQGDGHHPDIYAQRANFSSTSVGLQSAERMVKTLRKLEHGMNKAQDELGYTQDWAEFARRVLSVLGVKEVWFVRDNETRTFYSQSSYTVEYKLGDAANRMRRVIEKWASEKAAA